MLYLSLDFCPGHRGYWMLSVPHEQCTAISLHRLQDFSYPYMSRGRDMGSPQHFAPRCPSPRAASVRSAACVEGADRAGPLRMVAPGLRVGLAIELIRVGRQIALGVDQRALRNQ